MDERRLDRDLRFAHRLADLAAEVTMARFGERLPVETKADGTQVTPADREVEGILRREIARTFPGDGIHGEEGGLDPGSRDRLWIIDPVDGTALFALGIPLWSTLIALRQEGVIVVGVADVPTLGQRYHAALGAGAWRNDRPLHVSRISRLSEATVLYAGDGRMEPSTLRVTERARMARALSDAWGQLLIAQGSAEALLEHPPCFEWDWAAPSLIVSEAGGRVTTRSGTAPEPGCDLLVSNGLVHHEILAATAASEA
jgi:histidinol-phosphatase